MKTRDKWKCDSCGAIPRKTPQIQTLEIAHPDGAITVLGRKVELVAEMNVWKCPKCHAAQCVSVRFPLDPDALLIGEVFDVSDSDVPVDDIIAYVKLNNITADDLKKLADLKGKPGNAAAVLEWWTERGLSPVVVVPKDKGQADDSFLAGVQRQGIRIEESSSQPKKRSSTIVRFLRPASGPGSQTL